jgi:hypothetical protein
MIHEELTHLLAQLRNLTTEKKIISDTFLINILSFNVFNVFENISRLTI